MKLLRGIGAVGLALITTSFVLAPPVSAKPAPKPSSTTDPVSSKEKQAVQLSAQIQANQVKLGLLAEKYDLAAEALNRANADLAVGQVAFDEAKKAEDATRLLVAGVAVARYVDLDQTDAMATAAKSGDDPARAYAYVRTVAGRDAAALRQLMDARKAREAALEKLKSARDAAAQAEAQAAKDADAAQQAQADLSTVLSKVQGDLVRLVGAVDAAQIARNMKSAQSNPQIQFTPVAPLPPPSPRAQLAVQVAETKLGKPYQWGATGPSSFDCSGLTSWAWGQVGIDLPRVAQNQYLALLRVPLSQLQPGDLVFFGTSDDTIHHVGMFVGDGKMINAPYTGVNVRFDSIFWNDLYGFGRVFEPPH